MNDREPEAAKDRLPLRTLLSYGSSYAGLNAMLTMVGVQLMFFYTTVIHIAPAVVSLVMALAMVWDAVTDPLMGWLSDRTRWTWGRRRPYILLGSVPAALFFFLVFSPPVSFSSSAVAVFFGATFLLYFTFRTVWETPYGAMAPELTLDYDERTRVSGYQQVFGTVGDVLAVMAPVLLVGLCLRAASPLLSAEDLRDGPSLAARLQDDSDPFCRHLRAEISPETMRQLAKYERGRAVPDALERALLDELNRLLQGGSLYDEQRFAHVKLTERTQDLIEGDPKGKSLVRLNRLLLEEALPREIKAQERMGWSLVGAVVGVVAIASALCTYWGTRENPKLAKPSKLSLRQSLRATLRNRPYLFLVLTSTCTSMSNYTTIAVARHVMKYWFAAGPLREACFFGAFFVGVFLSIPLWMKMTDRIGKKAAYLGAMLVYSVILWSVMLLGRGDHVLFGVLMVLAGAFNIGLWLIPGCIVPDIIEWDQLRVGERREGAYYGVWSLVRKAGVGGAYIIIGLVLTWAGFDSEAPHQTARALWGMRLLLGPIPSILLIIGAIVFLKFPITKAAHRDMLRQLAERRDQNNED